LGRSALWTELLDRKARRNHRNLIGAIATAVAQQHLRQILGNLGVLVMGGEAYVAFKPGLTDDANNITDERTRQFLQSFVDQLAAFISRLSGREAAARAA